MKNNQNPELQQALNLINSPEGQPFVEELEATIKHAVSKSYGEKIGNVESSIPLTAEEKHHLESALDKILKRKISFVYTVNSNLLGGVKVMVGNWKLDGSLRRQIDHLKEYLGGVT